MTVSEIMTKMVAYSNGNLHNINHFLKVYAYAKTIGECEHLPAFEQECLEIAAIVHDIACPPVPGEIRHHRRPLSGARGHGPHP